MILERARNRRVSRGWVLYGHPDHIGEAVPENTVPRTNDWGKWFERWFPTEEKALGYATKKGWPVTFE